MSSIRLGHGRVRFEVTLRLGNATLMMANDKDNEDGRRKINPHFTALLDKYVSIELMMKLGYFQLF